jgi:hypothetical protein
VAEPVRAGRTVGVALGVVAGPVAAVAVAPVAVADRVARPGVGATVDVAGPVAADGIPVDDGFSDDKEGELVAVGRAVGALGVGTGVALAPCAGLRDGAGGAGVARPGCAGPTGWL